MVDRHQLHMATKLCVLLMQIMISSLRYILVSKFHKLPYESRFIAYLGLFSDTDMSILRTSCLTAIKPCNRIL